MYLGCRPCYSCRFICHMSCVHFVAAILCPAPECPSFAEVVMETTPYVYGTTVTYSCLTGFDLIAGDTERMCLGNRRWSGVKPLCRSEWTKLLKDKKGDGFVSYTEQSLYKVTISTYTQFFNVSGLLRMLP